MANYTASLYEKSGLSHEEHHVRRFRLSLIGITILMSVGSGCGSDSPPDAATQTAGPNRRIKLKDEYKQAVDKDGHMIMKPGMKKPATSAVRK
jgi:hypothetical protein